MRYWWVNQNQTYKHEVQGGYLWSPRRKSNGLANPFYDFMREVGPGDLIFSFCDTRIRAIGIANSHAYEAPKPVEFASTGAYWELVGWRVDVIFQPLVKGVIRPSEHMDQLATLLPQKYAPLRSNGAGLQSVYLTNLPESFANALIEIMGSEAKTLRDRGLALEPRTLYNANSAGQAEWEEHQLAEVRRDNSISETSRMAIVLARRGQGLFKSRVMEIEGACRLTGVTQPEHLRASHCKPWRDAKNDERLDGENGLLLTPTADHLFDRGFITFEGTGELLVSPVADREALRRMGIEVERRKNVGSFSLGQRRYLEYHRENVFLASKFLGERRRHSPVR